ncbi:MAG: ferritin-like domain-containing protein [Chloroflexota bacterium]|nr:ferritin-like domain-containing protein [Chloroflexota bacterium]MDQ5866844.1 ferritin-like domain-containing protein [Chloroflexota bacterium]
MDWVEHFARNRAERIYIPWELGVHVPPHLRSALANSLQRFQIGESGDGAHLRKVAARTGNRQYAMAVEAFIREEQEHAAIMAGVLRCLDAPLLEHHWSNGCFRLLCLVSGLRTELLVLLVAELVAKRYFRLLLESTSDPVVGAMCRQILHDEDGHIAFHCHALRPSLLRLPVPVRWALRAAWRAFFGAACLLVTYDHRALLRATGCHSASFHRECLALFDTVASQVFASETRLRKASGSTRRRRKELYR